MPIHGQGARKTKAALALVCLKRSVKIANKNGAFDAKRKRHAIPMSATEIAQAACSFGDLFFINPFRIKDQSSSILDRRAIKKNQHEKNALLFVKHLLQRVIES